MTGSQVNASQQHTRYSAGRCSCVCTAMHLRAYHGPVCITRSAHAANHPCQGSSTPRHIKPAVSTSPLICSHRFTAVQPWLNTAQRNTPAAHSRQQPSSIMPYCNKAQLVRIFDSNILGARSITRTCGCVVAHVSHDELHQVRLLHANQLRHLLGHPGADVVEAAISHELPPHREAAQLQQHTQQKQRQQHHRRPRLCQHQSRV